MDSKKGSEIKTSSSNHGKSAAPSIDERRGPEVQRHVADKLQRRVAGCYPCGVIADSEGNYLRSRGLPEQSAARNADRRKSLNADKVSHSRIVRVEVTLGILVRFLWRDHNY